VGKRSCEKAGPRGRDRGNRRGWGDLPSRKKKIQRIEETRVGIMGLRDLKRQKSRPAYKGELHAQETCRIEEKDKMEKTNRITKRGLKDAKLIGFCVGAGRREKDLRCKKKEMPV